MLGFKSFLVLSLGFSTFCFASGFEQIVADGCGGFVKPYFSKLEKALQENANLKKAGFTLVSPFLQPKEKGTHPFDDATTDIRHSYFVSAHKAVQKESQAPLTEESRICVNEIHLELSGEGTKSKVICLAGVRSLYSGRVWVTLTQCDRFTPGAAANLLENFTISID